MKKAKEVGVELFVLDDRWFGTRNDDYQGLGDWFVNKNKLPDGISGLSRKIEAMGLLATSANVADFGTFGYELDLLSDEELKEVREQVAFMKKYRELIQVEGDFYRILSPFEGNETAWMVVSRDKKHAVAGYYERLNKVNAACMCLRFKGLDEKQLYTVK